MFVRAFSLAGLCISGPDPIASVAGLPARLPIHPQHAMMCANALRFMRWDVRPSASL